MNLKNLIKLKMIINKNSWFAMYYNWVYGFYPNDICSFFWGSLFAILVAPLMLPGKALAITGRNEYGAQVFVGVIIWVILTVTTATGNLIFSTFGYEFTHILSMILGGLGIGIVSFASLGVAMWLAVKLFKTTGKSIPETHFINDITDFIAAVRGKYCTKIIWKG